MLLLQEENRKQELSPWQLPECLSLSQYCGAQSPGLQGLGPALSFLLFCSPNPAKKKKTKTTLRVLLSSYLFQAAAAAAEVPVDNLEIALSRNAEN